MKVKNNIKELKKHLSKCKNTKEEFAVMIETINMLVLNKEITIDEAELYLEIIYTHYEKKRSK